MNCLQPLTKQCSVPLRSPSWSLQCSWAETPLVAPCGWALSGSGPQKLIPTTTTTATTTTCYSYHLLLLPPASASYYWPLFPSTLTTCIASYLYLTIERHKKGRLVRPQDRFKAGTPRWFSLLSIWVVDHDFGTPPFIPHDGASFCFLMQVLAGTLLYAVAPDVETLRSPKVPGASVGSKSAISRVKKELKHPNFVRIDEQKDP